MRILYGSMYYLDLFKRPFVFNILKKDKQSTFCGFLMSLIVFFAISFSIFQSDMVLKRNPNVIDKTTSVELSPLQQIGNIGAFAFGLVDINRTGYIDERYARIEIFSNLNIAGVGNSYQYFPVKCDTKWNFNLKDFNTSNYQCLSPGDNYTIQGKYDQNLDKTFAFMLRVCNNLTDGLICKSEEEIAFYLQNKMFFLYFPSYSYDIDYFDQPYSYTPKTKIISFDLQNSYWININMKKSIFSSDDNYLFNDPQELILSELDYVEQYAFKILDGTLGYYNNFTNPLAMFYFSSSNNIHYISRRYQKFQEVLANAAGLANTLMLIGFILTNFQLKLSLIVKIINKLYISLPKQNSSKIRKKRTILGTSIKSEYSIAPSINNIGDIKRIITDNNIKSPLGKSKFNESHSDIKMVRMDSVRINNAIETSRNILITNLQTENDKMLPHELPKPTIEGHSKDVQIIKNNDNLNEKNKLSFKNLENIRLSFKNTNEIHKPIEFITTNQYRQDQYPSPVISPITEPNTLEQLLNKKIHKSTLKFNTITFIKAKIKKTFRKKLSYEQQLL